MNTTKDEAHKKKNVSYLEKSQQNDSDSIHMVKEPEPAYLQPNPLIAVNWNTYDRQGTYTLEDYLALPDDQRVELIDGVIYDMGSPTSYHQLIGGEVHRQISNYIHEKKGTCVPFIAPTDVQLDCDNRTIVEPDVMIVCDRSKITFKRIFGAPDFVLEVLSPSTKNKDIFVKGAKYMKAGVREYWMIDPMKQTITTYDFQNPEGTDMKMYTFEDTVPISIYDGDLTIDFKEITRQFAFLF